MRDRTVSPRALDFVYVVPVGPSAHDVHRCADLLESIRCNEPRAAQVYLAHDGNNEPALARVLAAAGFNGTVVMNPRPAWGVPWLGRLTFGLVCAYRRVLQDFPDHAVCRIDTDALVLRPFAEDAAQLLAGDGRIGMIGSSGLTESGVVAGNGWPRRAYQLSKPVARWDLPPYFRQNLFGANARLRQHVVRATARGYRLGASVCGGAYLIRAETLAAMFALPGLDREAGGCTNDVTEDVFFSILACEAGYRLEIQRLPGDVFGVAWRGLPGRSLPAVWERGNAVIHSVKTHGAFSEDTTREFFREKRRAGWPRPNQSSYPALPAGRSG